ncbi:MAG: Flagellar hook-length control protein FliK, partial [Myxococcaceae bacterium]|nr:Flagellar hook-length control protein FliK [Myxococcaceae bacterium]
MASGDKRSPRNHVRRASLAVTAGAAAVALGLSGFSGACGGTAATPSEGGAPGPTTAVSNATQTNLAGNVDLGRIIERVHFAFRPALGAPGAVAASHATYTVHADAKGAVTITPARPSADRKHRSFGSASTFATTSIGRGGANAMATKDDARAPHVDDDGGITIARGVADERWTNHDDGTRVAWAFSKKPAGKGDLLVRVGTSGTPFTTKTSGGAHFLDAKTGLGLRFGRATWVDASGKGTDVAIEVVGGSLVLRVPSAVVEASSWPARLDPTVSPEIAVDDVVRGPETRGQAQPTIATDGTDYFVAWTDNIYIEQDQAGAIRGTRITAATGAVLDVGGLDISTNKLQGQTSPHVAYDNATKQYVVVWTNTGGKLANRLHLARVLAAGTIVDSPSLPVGSISSPEGGSDPLVPKISCTDGKCLVVATTNVGTPLAISHNVVGIPLDLSLATNPVGTQFTIAGTAADELEPAVATGKVSINGTGSAGAVVTWRVANKLNARQVRFDGTLLGTTVELAGTTLPIGPSVVAYDGAKYLVVWTEQVDTTSTYNDIQGAYFTDGAGDLPFPIAATFEDQVAPAVTPVEINSGNGFLVTWQDHRTQLTADIYGVRVGDEEIKFGGGGLIKGNGSVFQIATGTRNETAPTVACATTNCFVAWEVTEPGPQFALRGGLPSVGFTTFIDPSSDIFGARITKSFEGAPVLDPGGIVLSTAANGETGIVSASDGKSFMLAWNDSRNDTTSFADVFGAVITPTGDTAKLVTPTGIAIATASGAQQVAGVVFDGTSYLVVWNDESNGVSQGDVYARRFSPKGVALGAAPFAVTLAPGRQAHATVAFDKVSKRALVAWTDEGKGGGIHASLVANDDTLVNVPTKGVDLEIDPGATPVDLTAASAGGGFLLAWSAGSTCGPIICQVSNDVLFTAQVDSN